MPEPNTTTAGIVIGSGLGLSGTLLGAPLDALLVGLVASVLVSFWLPSIDNRGRAAAAVAFATLLAGWGAEVTAGWLAVNHAGLAYTQPLRLLLAVVIGGTAPPVVPFAIGKLKTLLGGSQ